MDNRQGGIRERCNAGSTLGAFEIACPGCRRQRHSSGAGECARTERLGQRSERHRQCGQSARDPAAGNKSGYAAHRIRPFCWLPDIAGAASGEDQTNAICGSQIASRGQGNGAGARQADRRQEYKHLQGMLNSIMGLGLLRQVSKAPRLFGSTADASEYWIARLRGR
jgi:hypothetical protein